jgi:hypothetical protein
MTGAPAESRLGAKEPRMAGMDPDDLRIGDAEREHTMEQLREHFAQGRLDRDELDERLDRTLAARTRRDLAQVTADLPGPAHPRAAPGTPVAPGMPGMPGAPGMDDWRAAMQAHRHQMEAMRRARREMRHGPHGRHPRPHGHRHDPGPLAPILFAMLILAMIFGGWGVVKVLLVLWIGALIFSSVHRRFHDRR